MSDVIETSEEVNTPYCDYLTRNLVLQLMDESPIHSGEGRIDLESYDYDDADLYNGFHSTERPSHILHMNRVNTFAHTKEHYDESDRMREYKSIKVVRTVPGGLQAEIAKNPLKFLNLSEGASYGQIRAAWIILSKLWHPDFMHPETRNQFQIVFGYGQRTPFPLDTDPQKWLDKMEKLGKPEELDEETLAALSPEEQARYRDRHAEYRAKELEYEKVQEEMRTTAHEKMIVINAAYEEAKKRFPESERKTLVGFNWDRIYQKIDLSIGLGLDKPFEIEIDYQRLRLEGLGELQRGTGHDDTHLVFDHGGLFDGDRGYRQGISLRELFAWMELQQGKELSPRLLDGVTKYCDLDVDGAEQLRQMIMNHESPLFIIRTLGISGQIGVPGKDSDYRVPRIHLRRFLTNAYEGPTYCYQHTPREFQFFLLGVEITSDGSLVLKYNRREEEWGNESRAFPFTDVFSPSDFQMMQIGAYGPMLH